MNEIAAKKAHLASDNRLWSPLDALEDAANSIKECDLSKINLGIHWFEVQPDGSRKYHYCSANCTFPEHMALLQVALKRMIDDWVDA